VSELLDIAERILDSAKAPSKSRSTSRAASTPTCRPYQGEIEELSSASSSGIGVRVLRDGVSGAQVGTAWAGSLDESAIEDVLREARDNARFATEDEFVALARPTAWRPRRSN